MLRMKVQAEGVLVDKAFPSSKPTSSSEKLSLTKGEMPYIPPIYFFSKI